ncbi:hypothetical protein TL16_g10054 [Triparma laevis f. inornata]|uniref:Cationic amino acid transporter C-terminal domain-containing protein n=1 Tax=Triparma laevis f. inornata TaxID=1714386 RepID=A0A9W7BBX4_9STRA|nr:hypothetical protein TL16_g10054 [Triparma laevis f. inornata]
MNVLKALKRRKPIVDLLREQNSSKNRLSRTLGVFDIILYGVGSSVGAGIYSLIGVGAEEAGPAISLSFLFCGIACIFTSLSYSEFSARVPIAGSAYTFVYASFGEFAAWLVGWNLTLGYGVSAAVIARSWAEYLSTFIESCGTSVPSCFTHWVIQGVECNPLSVVIILACTVVLCLGVKESTKFNAGMTIINLCVLLFVLVAGSPEVTSDSLEPFAPQGVSGVAKGAGLVFFAYLGFDMVACLSEEVKDPQKNMPIGIIGSLIVSISIYVCLSLGKGGGCERVKCSPEFIVGMAPIEILGRLTPISNAFKANGCCSISEIAADVNMYDDDSSYTCLKCEGDDINNNMLFYGSKVINFGALFGLTTACFTCQMGQPRIFYRMAKDGLLFSKFGQLSETSSVPVFGTIMTGLMVSALAFAVDLEALANMISLGTLQVFTFVNAGVIILRTTRPDVNGNKVPFLIIMFCACIFLASLSINTKWVKGLLFFVPFLLVGGAVLCTAALMSVPRARPPNSFKCPFVPVIPLMGIACNVFMMGSMDKQAWVHIGFWLAAGVAIYFSYGVWNSTLRDTNKFLLGRDVVGGNYDYGTEPLIEDGGGASGNRKEIGNVKGNRNRNRKDGENSEEGGGNGNWFSF